ncbi:hypothetical protein [Dyadobacter sp. 32]|uniref:hypothetical protein n=1 Tax=Dyadobacter sp. 32 TaxID=538966 RepID=UPI0011EC0809
MKRSAILHFGFLLSWLYSTGVIAQKSYQNETIKGYQLHLQNVIFDSTSGNVYKIPLRSYGLPNSNYGILLSASVEGDTNSYHIPGMVNDEDSFGFRLKPGNRNVGDTLFIIRRTGEKPIHLSKIRILAFGTNKRNGLMPSDKAFTAYVLSRYVRPASAQVVRLASYYSQNQ